MPIEFLLITDTAGPVFQRSIGAYQVAHHVRKHGVTTQVIDFASMFDPVELKSLVIASIDEKTLAVGISSTFLNVDRKTKYISADRSFENAVPDFISNILFEIKEKYPKVKLVIGGANSYHVKDDTLFDAVFHGYSEQSVAEYLVGLRDGRKRIWPQCGKLTVVDGAADHFDIENLDHFWHTNDCILPKETLPIEISRGCIFKCKFCSYPLNGKKKFDYLRDPIRIRDELIKNYELYGTTNYFFTDDTFNDSTHKLEKLHEIITQLPFKIKFVTYLRIDLLYAHQEQIQLLYEMGLGSAFFGIETLNAHSGRVIGKGMNPDLIKKFIIELHDVHWKKEVDFTCSFIIGLPGETLESVKNTHEWCVTAPFNDVWFPLFLKTDSHYKSEFDINFEQYGYTKYEEAPRDAKRGTFKQARPEGWYNEHMDYQTALDLAEQFNNDGIYKNKKISTWFLFSMLNHGYTFEEAKEMYAKDLSAFSIIRRKQRVFNTYKEKLLKVLSSS